MLIPNVRCTWAPRGQTPVLRHFYRHDRISVISAITVSSLRHRFGLYARFHRTNITGVEVIDFLRVLLRHIPGPIVLLWDGGSIHRRVIVKEFLHSHPRLHAHRFPAYAPELNPDEFVRTHAKHELANGSPKNLDELDDSLRQAIHAIRNSQTLIDGCIRASELPWR